MIDLDLFSRQFFGPSNDFSLPPTWRSDVRYANLAHFIDDVAAAPARPVLLPRRHNNVSYIYAKAFGAPMGRRLAEALAAFVGPTYTEFVATPTAPRSDDPVDMAIEDLGAGPMWRLEVPHSTWRAAWEALALLRVVWLDRPVRSTDDVVPVGRLLREFRISLATADEQLSAACLQRLVSSGALDAANIAFLRVRRHDALGYPERALDGAEVDDLFRMRLPTAVREALLVAVHRRHLAAAADRRDPEAGRDVLLRHPQFASLLSGPAQLARPEAQAALLALALAFPSSADADAPTLRMAAAEHSTDSWMGALCERLPRTAAPSAPSASHIRDLLEDGAYGAAWDSIEALPKGVLRDRLSVHCALGLADPVRTADLHQALMRRGDDYLHEVLPQQWQFDAWQHHVNTAGLPAHAMPRDWIQFLDKIAMGEDLSGLVGNLDEVSRQWPSLARHDRLLSEKLAAVPLDSLALSSVLDALPLLLDSLDDNRASESSGVAISLILLSEDLNEAALAALGVALRLFLTSGPSASRYQEVVGSVADAAPRLVQVRTADRVLDIIDLLLSGPIVDHGTCVSTCQDLLARVRGLARRLSPSQLVLAKDLSAEASLDLTWPAVAETGNTENAHNERQLAESTVLLYSLQQRVLDRVRGALLQVVPGLTVHTSSEHDGSDRLKDQAQASDLVVLATRRATHAATGFIERWTAGQVVYVPGAGSASMLRTALAQIAIHAVKGE